MGRRESRARTSGRHILRRTARQQRPPGPKELGRAGPVSEEAVSGAKKKSTGGRVAYQRFGGVNALADARAFADGIARRQQQNQQNLADGESKGEGTRDLAISELNASRDHALEEAKAAGAAISEVEDQLEAQQVELERHTLRVQVKSHIAEALDGVSYAKAR